MNLQALKYLIALAEHCHFGKAAEKCFVTQPTLSMQIRKLEDELGLQLLERNNKTVRLTEIGLSITEYAQKIIQDVKAIQELAKAVKDPFSGSIKLGVIPTLAPYLLPLIVPSLSKTFPKLHYYWVEEQTEILLQRLKLGELDCAIVALPIKNTEFTLQPLFSEEFLLAMPENHFLAKRKTVHSKDLAQFDLLLLREGHCLRDQALEFCRDIDEFTIKDFSATSLETLRHMVAAGLGLTLFPRLACKDNDGIRYVAFSAAKPSRHLGMLWRKTSAKANLFQQLSALISGLT